MIYSLLYTLAMLLAAPFLLLGRTARKKYLHSLRERLGKGLERLNPGGKPSVWVHAVSVGEALAAKALVAELHRRLPGYSIVVSTTTATGREIAEANLEADQYFFFPLDWKFAVRRALRATGARLCIVMETELWPNFIRVLSARGVPLVLANGRISDRSFRRYSRLRWFFGPLLRRFHTLCAQSELDAERLVAIGAGPWDVVATGNLKYRREQFEVPAGKVEKLRKLLALNSRERLFVAGSTHEGEEEAALGAFEKARVGEPSLRLALVPRKPDRFDEVAGILKRGGWDFKRYTELEEKAGGARVVLVDAVGVLKALYKLAATAFVGGSLAPVGGHNLLEASAAGVPVLFGPHMGNFRAIAADVLRCGAGCQVRDAGELGQALVRILEDDSLRRRMAEGAAKVLEGNQEALPRTVDAALKALARWGGLTPPSLPVKVLARAHAVAAALFRRPPEAALRKANRLPAPTVSVGGLSFGGAGKSPMTALLAREFIDRGEKVAVLTRGYGGKGPEPFVVSDGTNICADAALAGDEPVMLARSVPGLIVVKDGNRLRAGRLALERWRPTLFLLDDGFQHRAVARDFNLLLLDADSIVGPRTRAHLLREPLRFAAAADAVVIVNGGTRRGEGAAGSLRDVGVEAPIHSAAFKAVSCRDLHSGDEVPLEDLREMRLLAFCGIAAPARFPTALLEQGVRPVDFKVFRDHHPFSEHDLARLTALLKAAGGDAMITTEKDAQRLRSREIKGARILVLKVRLVVDQFEDLFGRIERSLKR